MKRVLYRLRWWLATMLVVVTATGVWAVYLPQLHDLQVSIARTLR